MHYGTIPIVRETGGLKDTVEPYNMYSNTGNGFTLDHYDAGLLLEQWSSESENNVTGYADEAFDILIRSAQASAIPDARDAYLHDAEAILLEDSPVIPVICRGGSFQLKDGLAGMYRLPDGVFFLYGVHPVNTAN